VAANNFVFSVNSNGTSYTSPTGGCTLQYLGFNGTQGGIYVSYPSSGITIQYNAFYNNNPAWNLANPGSYPAIDLDGQNLGNTASAGESYVSILWNTFFNNCTSIQANGYPDSGGDCNAVHVQSYNNYLTIQNNVVNQTEEGFKFYEQAYQYAIQFNVDVEKNNMQGNSRMLIEDQQPTNANAVFSHNAFYRPTNPSFNTFEISVPLNQCANGPGCTANGEGASTVVDDNVYIGNVPVTIDCDGTTCVPGGIPGGTGSGAHYGIGLEQWGAGATANYNLFQGGNGPDTCAAGYSCAGWSIVIGLSNTSARNTNNYFSGYDVSQGGAFSYEDGGSSSNAGMVLSPNTVVATSTTMPTVAPAIAAASGTQGSTITLSDSDTNHALSLFYTTDGTTPGIFGPGGSAGTSRVYNAPFMVAAGTTVKATASWGQGANQGIVFPSFGYVPSSVTTLVVAAAARTLVSAYLHANANTMATGETLQFNAYGAYSDGSVSILPDAEGNAVTGWNTSNHSIAKISSKGHVTAAGTGKVDVQATIGSLKSSPWTVTVASPVLKPAVADAAVAAVAPIPATPSTAAVAAPVSNGTAPASTVPSGPIPEAPGGAQPDGFLGPFWRLVSPTGGSASISNSHLFIGVPGGSNHDPLLPSNQAVRVVQTIGNSDFDVSIKIDSPLFASDANTSQGLMVLSDNEDFTTFALTTDGAKIGLSGHTVTHGVATTLFQDNDFSQYQNPMYLRLTKAGSAYVALYSVDGVNWTQAASVTNTIVPTAIGPFASNYNDSPGNAVPVVMSVNWFDVQQ
jgi:Fn3 associated/Bacterial Ig-like domain (group 2)